MWARRSSSRFLLLSCACVLLFPSATAWAQTAQTLGSIIGRIRVVRGDTPPERILVNLEYRGATISSVYTDSQGTFGFHTLSPNTYTLIIDDDHYQPMEKIAVLEATSLSPITFVDITLIPKNTDNPASDTATPSVGSNPNMIDVRGYSARFPKRAVKEFDKGLSADAEGKREDAIRHYLKAVAIAPDFYLAHNNLGSDYMGKSDFAGARTEFEKVVQLNQSDAAAYFNLSNVCMLSNQMPEAQQFLDEGLRRQPDSAFGQFLLGSLNLRQNKIPQAEAALLRAIQLDPAKPQYRLQLVNLLLQQGRRDAAASQLRDFLATLPDSAFSAQARQVLQKLEATPKPAAVPN